MASNPCGHDRDHGVRWFGSLHRFCGSRVWAFDYVLRHVDVVDRSPSIYYRWSHELLLSDRFYILRVATGEGSLLEAKPLGDLETTDAGKALLALVGGYLITYPERLRALEAYPAEFFDPLETWRGFKREVRSSQIPARAAIIESLRDLGGHRELNQSVAYVNSIYVMRFSEKGDLDPEEFYSISNLLSLSL